MTTTTLDKPQSVNELAAQRLQQIRINDTNTRRLRNMDALFVNANGIPYNSHTSSN